jgi:hypothetical protein
MKQHGCTLQGATKKARREGWHVLYSLKCFLELKWAGGIPGTLGILSATTARKKACNAFEISQIIFENLKKLTQTENLRTLWVFQNFTDGYRRGIRK